MINDPLTRVIGQPIVDLQFYIIFCENIFSLIPQLSFISIICILLMQSLKVIENLELSIT